MAMQLVIIFLLTLCFVTLRGQNMVNLPEGDIIGTTMTTRKGRNISAYLGIPYAEPPVGDLRFEKPERKMKFDSVLPGDTDGNICPQLNDDGKLIGNEDCLFLNVYTPKAIPGAEYPVMVYFHAGFFVKGSGSSKDAGPQYFLDKDIVLVTLNYRLGALGFLSTGDANAPGNFGLKDQRLALQWVRDNILAFGGDPNRVTIFGSGAGGYSTNLHAASEGSAGLFQQYIAQSSPANFLAFKSNDVLPYYYKRYASDLGKKLDCPTENSRALIKCLRGSDLYDLANTDDIFFHHSGVFSTWVPTNEDPDTDGLFTTSTPLELNTFEAPLDVPSMMGIVANEGILLTGAVFTNDTAYDRIKKDVKYYFRILTALALNDRNTGNDYMYGNQTIEYYLNDVDVNDRKAFSQAITDFVTDAAFANELSALLYLTKADQNSLGYQYSFDYRGTFSYSSLIIGNNENIGASHGDELIYLFPMNPKLKTSPDLEFSESDEKMIDIMIDLWTSFAYTGAPVTNSTSHPVKGEAYEPKSSEKSYLRIGYQSDPEVNVQRGLRKAALDFWTQIMAYQMKLMMQGY